MTIVQFIREPECLRITGLSRATRWRLEKEGKFPKRCKISQNTIGWLASDLEEWAASRINNSNQELPRIFLKRGNKRDA